MSIEITVTGFLAADPNVSFTKAGTSVAHFTVMTNRRYQDGNGQWKTNPDADVFRVTAWRGVAERVAEADLRKGEEVEVQGTHIAAKIYQPEDADGRPTGPARADLEMTARKVMRGLPRRATTPDEE
ncbi:MAG: single-stranded DNA-binding protein [Pseudonocardia sp.]|nr:single-stranded DNA-binding protein [Pseudonocardia sp.]